MTTRQCTRHAPPRRLPVDELRTLFLFEKLTDDQLRWLSDNSRIEDIDAGPVFVEGEPAECFYVLLEGEVALLRRVGPDDVETTRTSQRGVYAGATQAYVEEADQTLHRPACARSCRPRSWCCPRRPSRR